MTTTGIGVVSFFVVRGPKGGEIQPPHGVNGALPAAFMTEATEPCVFIGVDCRFDTGRLYDFSDLVCWLHRDDLFRL